MKSLTVRHLFIYPIKSLGGIECDSAHLTSRGFQWDRRMMLVDEQGRFLTQREIPRLALLKTELQDRQVKVYATGDLGTGEMLLPLETSIGEMIRSEIWSDHCDSIVVSNEANAFFSRVLEFKVRLVAMPETTHRKVDENYDKDAITSFSDAFPILLIGTASLEDLNQRLAKNDLSDKMTWERFRPNLVIETSTAFEEDLWSSISVRNQVFRIVKPCARCVITTVNQHTAAQSKEPLRTLSQYRNQNNNVLFGQNVVNDSHDGMVAVGDIVSIR